MKGLLKLCSHCLWPEWWKTCGELSLRGSRSNVHERAPMDKRLLTSSLTLPLSSFWGTCDEQRFFLIGLKQTGGKSVSQTVVLILETEDKILKRKNLFLYKNCIALGWPDHRPEYDQSPQNFTLVRSLHTSKSQSIWPQMYTPSPVCM